MIIQRFLARWALPVFICVLFTQQVNAQTKTITGKVLDDKGIPVQGATITVKGSPDATSSGSDGAYRIAVTATAQTLVISSIGFTTQEVAIGDRTTIDISLVSSSQAMNEVVVIGYGTARKRDVTGAVSNITNKSFTTGNLANPIQQIQGKVPGLAITVPGGDPNQGVTIRLRGQASLTGGQTPLIVLDGVALDNPDQIANIPPGDIASYDVLKDASASAIYGSRGANGVIVINTKKGRSGSPLVEYNGFVSIDHLAKKYPMANATQWKQGVRQLGALTGSSQGAIDSSIATYDHGGNTDWQDAITRTGVTHSHNISVSGGANGFSYRGSLTYSNQQGIVINTGKEFVGLRLNVQQKALNNKLDIQAGIVSTVTNRKYADYNIFYEAYSSPPTYPVKNPDGSYFAYSDFALQNPVAQQMGETNTGKENYTVDYGTADYEIVKGLKVGVTGSLTYFTNQLNFYQPVFPVVNNLNAGAAGTENRDSKKGDVHVNYIHDWGKHNLSATAVYEYNDFTYNNQASVGQNFLLDQNQTFNLQGGQQVYDKIFSYKEEYKLISFLGRAAYNYDSRYYATASLRRDGSSKFGTNHQWGLFPAASVAWRISREKFMQDISWVNELKINAGFGVTGNQDAITPYSSQLLYSPVGNYYSNGSYQQSYSIGQNANPNLQWEERHGKNIGLEFSLFHSRLTGNFNVFDDKTDKLLYTYNLPAGIAGSASFPYPSILANVGSLTNKGVELGLNYEIIKGDHFTWTIGGQISSATTKVSSLAGSYGNGQQTFTVSTDKVAGGVALGRGLSSSPITYLKVGYAPFTFLIPHYVGLTKGLETYDSAGGTTTNINNASLHYINPSPKFNYGISSNFTLQHWDLSLFLRGVSGQKIFDNTRMILDNINRFTGNNGTVDGLTNGIVNSPQVSDHWLEKASYLRMENITLGYTVPVKGSIQSLRFYGAANNLFIITKYRGLDPEVRTASPTIPFLSNYIATATGNSNLYATGGPKGTVGTALPPQSQSYIDDSYQGDGFYPKSRSFTIGVNISFR